MIWVSNFESFRDLVVLVAHQSIKQLASSQHLSRPGSFKAPRSQGHETVKMVGSKVQSVSALTWAWNPLELILQVTCPLSKTVQNSMESDESPVVYIHHPSGNAPNSTCHGTYSGIRCSWRQVTWVSHGWWVPPAPDRMDRSLRSPLDSWSNEVRWRFWLRLVWTIWLLPYVDMGFLKRIAEEFLHQNSSRSTKANTKNVDALRLRTSSTRTGGSPKQQMMPASDPSWGSRTETTGKSWSTCPFSTERESYLIPNVSHEYNFHSRIHLRERKNGNDFDELQVVLCSFRSSESVQDLAMGKWRCTERFETLEG